MKTTIDIADNLLRAAKETAGREGTTVRALVEEGLRRVLSAHGPRAPFHLRDVSFRRGKGLRPQVREGSWAAIRELAYEGRGRMIAVDTNLLVYAHRADSTWHDAAARCLKELAEGAAPWALPWPCVHEFLAIVTHPRIYDPPTPLAAAIDQVEAWLEAPGLTLLAEATGYWEVLRQSLKGGRVAGPMVHDARVAALCRHHGVRELWTADRDFGRFPGLKVRNPLAS